MPTYLLNGDDRVTVATGPLHVTAWLGSGGPVRLVADGDDGPVDRVQRPRPGLMIVPRVAGRTALRVQPETGAPTFPDGATVNLQVSVQARPGQDADVVQLNAVDVSGLRTRDLAHVEPDRGGLAVTAVDAVLDDALDDLAARARTEARGRLPTAGVDRARVGDLLVGVDVSASMRPVHDDGSIEAILQVLIGLSYVVGRPGELDVALVGERARWLDPVPARELPARLRDVVGAVGHEVGFDPCVAVPAGSRPRTLFLVTDSVPPDPGALAAAAAADRAVRHLVVVAPTAAGRVPDPAPAGVHCTFLAPPPDGVRAADHLLAAEPDLRALVSALLAPWTRSSETPPGATR